MSASVTISIIEHRTAELTLGCLRSVLADLNGIDGQVVIVDNASGDGSAEEIAAWIDAQTENLPVQLVQSETNSGFSGGHNQGMAAAPADYYLVLNSDAVLRPGFMKTILEAAEANPDAGVVAPQIETDDGDVQVSCFRFHSPWSELIRGASSGPLTKILRRHVVALQPPVRPAEIEWASFACILLRDRMVREIGPMDEDYFLYFEDAEYCLRATRTGWKVHHEPQAVVVHYRGGSGPVKALTKVGKRLPAYYYSSRTRFFYQAHGRAGPVVANLMWHLGRGVAYSRVVFGRKVPPTIEAEARDLWTNVLNPLAPSRSSGD